MRPSTTILRTCVLTTAGSLCIALSPASAQTTQLDLKSQARGVDFSKAAATKPFKTGTIIPATCAVGESFFKSDAAPGQNLYGCTAVNSWTVQSGGGGLPPFTGNADHLLGTDGTQASWMPLGGDVSGAPPSLFVTGLQGKRVAATTPTGGQVLTWNSTALNWEPGTIASSSGSTVTNTGGDLSGAIGNATVTRMQNKPVSPVTPADGQVLTWSQFSSQWQPQSPTGGTGTGSGSSSGGISVLGVTYSSANTITIGAGCSIAAPCNVRFGTNVVTVTTSATVTWQSGAGVAFIYITSAGTVTVGSNLTVVCSSGCATAAGVAGFPVNSIPLFTWTALPTGWDAAGGHDSRAYLSSKILSAGTGMILVESGPQSTLGVDTTLIPTYTTGASTLAFGTLAASSCSTDLTVSVPGAVPGDALASGWPAALPSAVVGMMRVSAANTVAVRLCNLGASAALVGSAAYRATVVQGR